MAVLLINHPERNRVQVQLRENVLLAQLDESAHAQLAALLVVENRRRGEFVLHQGDRDLHQYFVLDGLLKRIVASSEGRELTLRFADAGDMETSHDAWRLGTSSPHAIVCVTHARIAHLPMKAWDEFLDRHPLARRTFDERVMRINNAMMSHAVSLHLLD